MTPLLITSQPPTRTSIESPPWTVLSHSRLYKSLSSSAAPSFFPHLFCFARADTVEPPCIPPSGVHRRRVGRCACHIRLQSQALDLTCGHAPSSRRWALLGSDFPVIHRSHFHKSTHALVPHPLRWQFAECSHDRVLELPRY